MSGDLNYYLELPYTIVIRRDEEGDFVARVQELPGCSAHGKSRKEALDNLEEAQSLWITDALEAGDPIPQPNKEDVLPSGKWVQRVPRTLHKKIAELAAREGVSLNQLVTSVLSEAIGRKRNLERTRAAMGGLTFDSVQSHLADPNELFWEGSEGPLVMLMPSVGSAEHGSPSVSSYCIWVRSDPNWSISHNPSANRYVDAVTRLTLDHLRKSLPNRLQAPLETTQDATKKEKAHRVG